MSVLFSAASATALGQPSVWFDSPCPVGRKIVCSFSYIQRIGKGAVTEVWFPAGLSQAVAERIVAGDASALDGFHVEWAAVRQFELMQESDNYYIYDLRVTDFKRAYDDIMKMRARGYRLAVVTMGRYVDPSFEDELRLLDERLQEEISQCVRMLYLGEQSAQETRRHASALRQGVWDVVQALPHVAMTMGAQRLFSKEGRSSFTARQRHLTERFFHILSLLPQRAMAHDVAVGLAIPDAKNRKNQVYRPDGDSQFTAFQNALSAVFRFADHLSLGALHERGGAGREVMATVRHMRGYGDRDPAQEDLNRACARYLRQAGALAA